MTKIIKKADMVAIVAFLVLALALLFMFVNPFNQSGGVYATISVNGVERYRFNIADYDGQTVTINTEFGMNQISFQNGRVSIYNADCPDHWCLRGHVPGVLRTITCLPNRLVVSIEGGEENRHPNIDFSVGSGEVCCG